MSPGRFAIDISPLRTSRDFRYVFAARLVSLAGIGVTGVALGVGGRRSGVWVGRCAEVSMS
ncbi:hypothetical protein [Sphaerisporangium perillae]|uniref:hypothetical protein n=1 Tax=Sphaerisporangium perillae TaxID=2935860 RepID=UPI00200F6039|nr:hypothetical protein [Sphaerisporangium perillae]